MDCERTSGDCEEACLHRTRFYTNRTSDRGTVVRKVAIKKWGQSDRRQVTITRHHLHEPKAEGVYVSGLYT